MAKKKDKEIKKTESEPVYNSPPPENSLYYQYIAESRAQYAGIPDLPGHIFFAIQPGAEFPKEILEIQGAIDHTAATLRRLYQEEQPDRFQQLLEELVSAAKLLSGPKPSPAVTANVVEKFQERIASVEGKAKKTRYLNGMGARIVGVIATLIAIVALTNTTWIAEFVGDQVSTTLPYLAVLFGTATIAMWLSFATRKPKLSFDDLIEPEGDMMGPSHRMAYVLMFSAVLALFAQAEVIGTIAIGKFSTDKISSDFLSAAVFGFACGFSEKLLASTVAPHVSKIMSSMGDASK